MREDPLPDSDPNEKFYEGDNEKRLSGEALQFKQLNIHAWEALNKGQDIQLSTCKLPHLKHKLLYKNLKINKEKLKGRTKDTIMEKYGNAASEEALPREHELTS
ncbi:pre-mRNA-splicing factor SLU7 [Canna indica]|uniref:Pre-mRNA-splicing factor SLU7 n=1 Tax=Canna indica TaxID=4628 RepID=A0AAQ3QRQ2_9LILI|nr:pre-mRNA-splicing factor SLU7 [Canna indica]